jgi:hypothetical protein
MRSLNGLAEARIREWQSEQRKRPLAEGGQMRSSEEPLEVSLWKSWMDARQRLETASPSERPKLLQRSREIELQLLVLLERTGRPLAARSLAERFAAQETKRAG